MKVNGLVLIAGALVLAGGAALIARSLLQVEPQVVIREVERPAAREPQSQPQQGPVVLVAEQALLPGDFVGTGSLRWQAVAGPVSPRLNYVQGDADLEALLGAAVRRTLEAGEPLTRRDLVRAGEPGFLAAVLRPGMRAVSLPVDAVTSHSGLVAPGDQVDLVLARDPKRAGGGGRDAPEAVRMISAQTVFSGLRVLAVNNDVRGGPAAEDEVAGKAAERRNGQDGGARGGRGGYGSGPATTVTLEVDPRQAPQLAVAQGIGTLHLSLRNPGDAAPAPGKTVATTRNVTQIQGTRPPILTYRGEQRDFVAPGL